jgi:hypothetical protein
MHGLNLVAERAEIVRDETAELAVIVNDQHAGESGGRLHEVKITPALAASARIYTGLTISACG